MVNNIVLTGSQKGQLLAIQRTQRAIDVAQQNLASGREVNNSLQDPQNFFAAQSLRNRSSDISRLLDGIGQSIQAVNETVTGTEAIQSLLDQAEALLIEAELELYADPGPFPLSIGNVSDLETYIVGQDVGGTIQLDNNGESVFFDGNLWKRFAGNYTIGPNTVLRFEYESSNVPEISSIGFDNDQNFLNDNDRFFIHGTQFGGIAFAAPINTFRYAGAGVETIEIPVGQFFQGDFDYITFIHDDDGPGDDGDATFSNITLLEAGDVALPADQLERAIEYEADYNEILRQIDLIAQDAHYRGINLLQDETLQTFFNEDLTSNLRTTGIDATSKGLGLTDANFRFLNALRGSIDQVKAARIELREYTASLQNNLSIITAREDFTRGLVNTLESGSDDLTLADQNKEGAEILSLQVRQQIQFGVLSFSANTPNVTQLV